MKPNPLQSIFKLVLMICWLAAPLAIMAQLPSGSISGTVRNQQNLPVNNAKISVFNNSERLITTVFSKEDGNFQVENLTSGNYKIVIEREGFQTIDNTLTLSDTAAANSIEITLTAAEVAEGLSVTAVLDTSQEVFEASQQTEYVTRSRLDAKPGVLLPQLLQEEKGVRLVQGSAFFGQVIIRGLTGQRVANLIDGVRFNNSTFTIGLEPTVGLIDTNAARRIELIYGPSSAIYGSDALGGTINVISDKATFFDKGWEAHGSVSTYFSSANAAANGEFKLNIGNRKFSLLVSGFGRRVNDLRAGDGIDSHSVVTRFLGLSSKLLGDRLQDTGYLHLGGTTKAVVKLSPDQNLSFFYQHTSEENTRIYYLLNGGGGGDAANFSPQVFDLFYTRYEKRNLGFLNSLTGTFSFNRQRQQLNFNSDPALPFLDELRRTTAIGYSLQATTNIGSRQFLTFGGEIYDEHAQNKRVLGIPALNQTIPLVGTFPNGASYLSYGAFIQNTVELLPGKIRLNGGVRYSAFFFKANSKDNPRDFFGNPTVPNLSIRNDDVTFNLESIFFIKKRLSIVANVTRGFRAPNIVDLGSAGPFPTGFQVLNSEAAAFGGFIGTTADATSRSTGKKLSLLKPENLLNYEMSVKYQGDRFSGSVTLFTGKINDFITDRALILPQGAVGKIIGGLPIVAQNPITGTVFVPIDFRPVVVKVNGTDIRLYGIETDAQIRITKSLTLSGNFSYLRGKDLIPPPVVAPFPGDNVFKSANDIPDIEGGLPPATGFISLRYQSQRRNFWIEAYSNLASYQDRLSSLDLADIRIGSVRSRDGIAFYFNNGAVARGFVVKGPNGQPILRATGETLQQVGDRVLGPGVNRAAQFTATPGYATFNLRGGLPLGERTSITIILENILDKNYRLHGSGVDAAGINLFVRYSWRF